MLNDLKAAAPTLIALGSLGNVQAQSGAGRELNSDGRRSLILPDAAGDSPNTSMRISGGRSGHFLRRTAEEGWKRKVGSDATCAHEDV